MLMQGNLSLGQVWKSIAWKTYPEALIRLFYSFAFAFTNIFLNIKNIF